MDTYSVKHGMGIFIAELTVILLVAVQCSDSNLYGKSGLDPSADRLALSGRVCTDDPQGAGFPVRVIFIVDQAAGPLFSSYDPEQIRIRELNETLSTHEGNRAFSFAVIGLGPVPRLFAPQDGYFTRNGGELAAASSSLALPQGCVNELCRNYEDSLFMAQSIIEGDLADMNAGERSRTQYVVVMVTGGAPEPLYVDWPETTTSLRDAVTVMKEDVELKASSFSFHSLQLAPQESPQETESLLREMAFAGNGTYERFNSPDAITFEHIGLLKLSALFEAKSLVVSNVNVFPGINASQLDSDGDGLSDTLERAMGTNATSADTDGDGVGDLVEKLTLLDPLVAEEKPDVCVVVAGPPYGDVDNDRLNDCEELLVGTDYSLTDTDGDGITDWIELAMGIDYLFHDYLEDSDWDGTNNGDEAARHTDPRANDAAGHLAGAYRYSITDEGLVTEQLVAEPRRILGVEVLESGTDTTGGVATLRFESSPPTLSWKDPQDGEMGPKVPISTTGEYILYSSSFDSAAGLQADAGDTEQGLFDSDAPHRERWIRVYVNTVFLPQSVQDDYLLVQAVQRHCISFTVRNIQLMETAGTAGNAGENNIYVYFSQAPAGDMMLPGLYRIAHIPVTYTSESGRTPSGPVIELIDEDFMTVGL